VSRRPTSAAGLALVLAVALMIPFEAAVPRVLGVLSILAFIVLGAFAVATPAFLAGEDEESPGRDR
jgi:hypothetical protein